MKFLHRIIQFLIVSIICLPLAVGAITQNHTLLNDTQLAHRQGSHNILIENLSIYNLLTTMQKNIELAIPQLAPEINERNEDEVSQEKLQHFQALQALRSFTSETISLFQYIVNEILNQGALSYNPEIEYKFVNTYSCLDMADVIKPWHLRKLKGKIEDLNNYIKSYCNKRKKFLAQQDIANFNAIAQLNFRLLDWILKDELMGIDYWDRLIDTCIYQPWEWVCKHKKFVIITSVVIAGMAWYFLAPFYNFNSKYDVVQYKVVRQSGDECPYHAIHNLVCLLTGNTPEEREALLKDNQALNNFLARFPERHALDEQELSALVQNHVAPAIRNNIIELPSADILRAEHPADRLDQIYEEHNIAGVIQNFVNGRPVGFIINIGSWEREDGSLISVADRAAHWICAAFRRDSNAKNGIRAEVADSIGTNRTNHATINGIIDKILLPSISPSS